MRNTALALGNWRHEKASEPLEFLSHHSSSLVRIHAAWALGQTPGEKAKKRLMEITASDPDSMVREEAKAYLI